eukprot:2263801-Amphidinium_carterae.3
MNHLSRGYEPIVQTSIRSLPLQSFTKAASRLVLLDVGRHGLGLSFGGVSIGFPAGFQQRASSGGFQQVSRGFLTKVIGIHFVLFFTWWVSSRRNSLGLLRGW